MTMSLSECRSATSDLRSPSPAIYFTDGGASAMSGWVLLVLATVLDQPVFRMAALFLATLLLYRSMAFIHELFHQQELKAFRWFWHAAVGVPLLLPLLLYLPIHQAHHNASHYGTVRDGEYDQFRGRRVVMSLRLMALNLLLPAALVVRFGALTPLGLLIPAVRREIIPAFVHLSLRMPFKAPELRGSAAAEARWVELACMLWSWTLVAALVSGLYALVVAWAVMVVLVAMLNTVRALCSTHLYVERQEGRDAIGQVADSLNIEGGGLLTKLLCPVGLQYHALHHLAPYLPYHALPEAHRRLMVLLPPTSIYHQATVPNLHEGWRRLVRATDAHDEPATSRTSAP
jgi:fatty acid desaturase